MWKQDENFNWVFQDELGSAIITFQPRNQKYRWEITSSGYFNYSKSLEEAKCEVEMCFDKARDNVLYPLEEITWEDALDYDEEIGEN